MKRKRNEHEMIEMLFICCEIEKVPKDVSIGFIIILLIFRCRNKVEM